MPGLYKLVATRTNGLLIREIDTQKTKFASSRKHQFTPLETVAIYTKSDSTELSEIFRKMKKDLKDLPLPEPNASRADLFTYFSKVLPDYDEDKVMISDVKKVVKWFKFLKERGLLVEEEKRGEEENKPTEKKEKEQSIKKEPSKKPKSMSMSKSKSMSMSMSKSKSMPKPKSKSKSKK